MMLKKLPEELIGSLTTLRIFDADFIPELFVLISARNSIVVDKEKPIFNQINLFFYDRLDLMLDGKCLLYGIFDNKTQSLQGVLEICITPAGHGQLQGWLQEKFFEQEIYKEALLLLLKLYFFLSRRAWINARIEAVYENHLRALESVGFVIIDSIYYAGRLHYDLLYTLPHTVLTIDHEIFC